MARGIEGHFGVKSNRRKYRQESFSVVLDGSSVTLSDYASSLVSSVSEVSTGVYDITLRDSFVQIVPISAEAFLTDQVVNFVSINTSTGVIRVRSSAIADGAASDPGGATVWFTIGLDNAYPAQ